MRTKKILIYILFFRKISITKKTSITEHGRTKLVTASLINDFNIINDFNDTDISSINIIQIVATKHVF